MEVSISQSILKDWLSTPCKKQFQFKHFLGFDMDSPDSPFFIGDREMIRFGNYYEQQIIGLSRGGKITELTPKEITSTKGSRISEQVSKTSDWLTNRLDGRIQKTQHKYSIEIDHNGQRLRLHGHVDIHFLYRNGHHQVIDLKLCDNIYSAFGPVINGVRSAGWGNVQDMDHKQPVHYIILLEELFGNSVSFIYHVADLTPQHNVKIFPIEPSPETKHFHLDTCLDVQNEIEEALMMDWFEPTQSYNTCCNCPVADRCSSRVETPNVEPIIYV